MKKLTVNEKAAYAIAVAMTALFLCTAILAVSLIGMLSKTEKSYSSYRTEAEIRLSELEKRKNEMNEKAAVLEEKLNVAEKTRAELELKISQTEKELSELEGAIGNTDELYKKLNDQLSSLKASLTVKEAEIEALKTDIKELSEIYGADLNRQYDLMVELYAHLEAAKGSVSVYYLDTERGHTFKYGETKQYPTACCDALPFVLSVMRKAAAGTDEAYDLSKEFVYTSDKAVSGAGVIKDSPDGTVYTYGELFGLYLKYEDAVAKKVLTDKYGNSLRNALLSDCGTTVMKNDPSKTTAHDLAMITVALKSFIYGDSDQAAMLRDAMKESVQGTMISAGIPNKTVLHQHGWTEGAYHDAALVMDDHPYVLVIATDLEGGDEANKYIQRLAAIIDDIHETFYK